MLRKLIGKLWPKQPAAAGRLDEQQRRNAARSETLRVRLRQHQLREEWLYAATDEARERIEEALMREEEKIHEIEERYFGSGVLRS